MSKLVAQNIPQIFDRNVLAYRRKRAAANFANYNFLHQRIADELCDRLVGQSRSFKTALVLGSFGGLLANRLRATKGLVEHIIETDLTPAMLPKDAPAMVMDAQYLALAPASCDLIISFWGLHHINDAVGTLIQIRQALKPNGVFIGAMAGGQTLENLRTAFLTAESELTGSAVMRVHPFADIKEFGSVMQRAQLDAPIIDSDIVTINYAEVMRLLYDLRGMGESNCLMAQHRRMLRRDVLAQAIAQLKKQSPLADRVSVNFEIFYLMGTRPK